MKKRVAVGILDFGYSAAKIKCFGQQSYDFERFFYTTTAFAKQYLPFELYDAVYELSSDKIGLSKHF